LFKEKECVGVAVHCDCYGEENFHFTETLKNNETFKTKGNTSYKENSN